MTGPRGRDKRDVCDRAGTASTEPQREHNRAKNQFCAGGPAALATEFSFTRLQAAAEDAGVTGVPADRSVLKDLHRTTEGDTIGEGSVVQLIGFLIKAKFSNVGKGETVNCELPDREENDIHINLVSLGFAIQVMMPTFSSRQ